MASNAEEIVLDEVPARRTRSSSARDTKPITDAPKPTPRKTKKKTIVVEVEVSDEEEEDTVNEPSEQPIISDVDDGEKKVDINKNDKDEELNNVDETNGKTEEVEPEREQTEIKAEEVPMEGKMEIDEMVATEDENLKHEVTNITNEVIKEESTNETEKEINECLEDENIEPIEDENIETLEDVIKMDTDAGVKEIFDVDVSEKEDTNPETEVISEDELPTVQAVKVPETEEVSDDELPGPKLAELPADTEVVSEDELPTVRKEANATGVKRKLETSEYDPGSPTSEPDATAAKRQAVVEITEEEKTSTEVDEKVVEKEKESKEKPVEKVVAKEKEGKSKLPELDKYWKAVNDDPTDFTGWTYLLQYVDQVNDIEAAREAYDAFLSHYPYCYGYWRKYADYEKRKGNKKKCEEVFERGLKAIPLSVDLWLHFLNYTKTAYAESEEHIREQFERALSACGLEFRSDRLWDTYVKWESEAKRLQNVTAIYDRLLATPTQGYTTHFDNFQEHVSTNPPNKILTTEEFVQMRKELRQLPKHEGGEPTPAAENPNIPPGEDDIADDAAISDDEAKRVKNLIVSQRRKIHKATVASVTARWNYEEGIKRPYFHVKPLERCQLKNWKEYLDFEIQQGDRQRITILFERCLIACALYEEFWLRFVKYLEDQKDGELQAKTREVYERACTVHHVGKPALHLSWAIYEEANNNLTKASEILVNLEKSLPHLLQVAYRRINLERRRGDVEKCSQLYESYISNSKYKTIASSMAIKYARFTAKICHDFDKAVEVLKGAIAKDLANSRLYLQLIDLYLQRENVNEKEILDVIDQFLEKETHETEQKVVFAQRKLEFLEDFGSDIQTVQTAYEDYQKYCKINKDKKKKEEVKGETTAAKKRPDAQPPLPVQQSTYNYGGNYSGPSQNPNNYSQYGGQQSGYGGQYGGQYSQGGGDQYQYQNWQYSQPGGYGGYNQWGNYYQ